MEDVHVSPARRLQLERTADNLIERAVDACERVRASASALDGWRLVRRKAGLRVLRPPTAPASAAAPVLLLGTGTVPGTVEDVMAGTFAASGEALRTSKALLSDKLIDGDVLRVFAAGESTASVVFEGIKWFALKAPAGGQIVRDRDLLLYERQGRIVDRSGRFFAYHVYHSVDLPERPANRDPGLARAFMSMCYLYSPSSATGGGTPPSSTSSSSSAPASADCFILGRFHPGGTVPPAIGAFVAAERMLSVSNAVVCAQARRFSRLAARAAARCGPSAPPSASRVRCGLCSSSAAPSTAAECAGCRRTACRRCYALRPVFRLDPRTRRPDKDAFCRECVDLVARASGGVGAFRGGRPQPPQRTRSSSEDAGPAAGDADADADARARAGTDAGPRTSHRHSLVFDPERQQYIRVFDGGRSSSSSATSGPGRPQRPLPTPTRTLTPTPPRIPTGRMRRRHPDVVRKPGSADAARHDRGAEEEAAKAARTERRRDHVFNVDALD